MERPRYGKERRVKRVRLSSLYRTDYSKAVENLCSDFPSPSPCKNTVGLAEVLPISAVAEVPQVVKVKTFVKKKQLVVKDEVKVGTEMLIWTEELALTPYSCTLCEECGRGDSAEEMLLCDKCDRGFHMFCLSPILITIPRGDWICPQCSQSTTAHGMFFYLPCLRFPWFFTTSSQSCK